MENVKKRIISEVDTEEILMPYLNGSTELPIFLIRRILAASYTEKETFYLLKEFAKRCKSDENQRVALEFLYMNGAYDILASLIERNSFSSNQKNKEWASVYDIILKRKYALLNHEQYRKAISDINVKDKTMKTLLMFLKVYTFFDMHQYGMLGNYLDKLTEQINQIENMLIFECFDNRLKELLFHYHWKRNELIMARKYGFKLVNAINNPFKRCDIHTFLAQTYLFDSYPQAMSHIRIAKALAEDFDHERLLKIINNQTIPFISSFHGEIEGITTTDPVEKAHQQIALGMSEIAADYLKTIKNPSPFQQYFLAKATNDSQLMMTSYNRFINERSDYFFAKLPLNELMKGKTKHLDLKAGNS